jgi:hypothetical protein
MKLKTLVLEYKGLIAQIRVWSKIDNFIVILLLE